jgi:flavin reductase (DIM6/NTAB) family NADH-FMN oxidoreductase RutF
MAKRPWNRIDLPVYSISSRNEKGGTNMHIITYATQISMEPKRYICGIYEGTQTLENVKSHPLFVLQLLASHQYGLIDLLGRKSGKQVNKTERLEKRKLLTQWKEHQVLSECLAVMEMKVIDFFPAGDHTAFLCEVTAYRNLNEGTPLTLNILRERKLIRI